MQSKKSKPLPSDFEGPYDSPGFLLWRVSNAWQREQRHALQRVGLTHTQFVALAVASWFQHDEPLTQAKLSQLTGSDPMTISQVVRTLEKAGHFKRIAHPHDIRARVIEVTATGRELAATTIRVVEETDSNFFEPLGNSDEIPALMDLFKKLLR